MRFQVLYSKFIITYFHEISYAIVVYQINSCKYLGAIKIIAHLNINELRTQNNQTELFSRLVFVHITYLF